MGIEWWFDSMPWVVGFLWILHAALSWYRPRRMNPVGWLLLAGLPVAAVVLFVVEARLYPPGQQPADAPLLDGGFALMLLAFEVAGCWLVVLLLETLLLPTRQARAADKRQVVV